MEISFIFTWYLFILALGWCSFPLAFTLFKRFPDRGFSLAKALGLFLISYVIWLTSSFGITQYHLRPLLVVLVVYVVFNAILVILQPVEIGRILRERFLLLFLIELIFLLVFVAAVIIRMYNPDLTGAEKEADFTLLNAILQSDSFPPKDTWFAGANINYYYFGYVIWATVIKATHSISPVGFNLALATIAGLAAIGSFGLVYRFTHRISSGLLSSGMLMVFGNLDGLIQLIHRRGQILPFDWWGSSRIIPDTINEFPYFSFLLGDLHAHFMAIPFVLVLLGLLSEFATRRGKDTLDGPHLQGGVHLAGQKFYPQKIYNAMLVVLVALLLGGISVINGWEFPAYLLLAGFCVCMALRSSQHWPKMPILLNMVFGLVIWFSIGILSRLLFWPFYQHFVPQLTIRNVQFVSYLQRTGVACFFTIYGLFLWGILPLLFEKLIMCVPLHRRPSRNEVLVMINSLLLVLALLYACNTERVFLIAAGVSVVVLLNWYQRSMSLSEYAFPLLLILMGFAIVAGCEILYIKDFYGHPLERQNTIFKFYYQSWILLSVGVPVMISSAWQKREGVPNMLHVGWKVGLVMLCCACSIYPMFATYEKTNRFRGQKQGGLLYIPTLNGSSYIAYRHPYEYEALTWIQEHLDKNAIILEATGDPYSFFGRVAATTGRSTVLGWGNHEALWRDQTWKSIQQRTEDITRIYEALDKTRVLEVLHSYQVEYIYIGTLEQERYKSTGLKAFAEHFPIIYENAQITIYKTPKTVNSEQ